MEKKDIIAWLQAVLLNTRDLALVMTDPQGVIVEWLGAAEWVLRYTREEAIGQPIAIIYTEEDRAGGLDQLEREVARAAGRSEDDRWQVRKGGHRFWASGVMLPILIDGQLVGFCKTLRDRTDVRTQLDALQHRLQRELSEREQTRHFLVTLGHEMRTPMTAIATAAEVLSRTHPGLTPIEIIKRQVGMLKRLADDVSHAAHVANRLPVTLDIQEVVLQDLLQQAVEAVRPAVGLKGHHLSVVPPNEPVVFHADPARVQQMLANLLSNAVKYTPPGGHITLSGSIEGPMVVVRVDDDGVGISDEVLPNIFNLFTRESYGSDAPSGLGVGLAVVKQLATLHGGGVEARSHGKGKGSQFALRLPVHPCRPEGEPSDGHAPS